MITPEYLDAVVKDTEETVSKVNMIIIRKIAQSIYKQWVDKGDINFMPSTLKQFKALMGTGLVAENIEYELAMIYPQIQKEIHKAFLNSASEMSRQQVDTAKQIIDIEGIDYDIPATAEQVAIATTASDLMLSKEQIRILENDYKRTNRTLKNITNTAGYSTEILYKDLCDELYMEVRQGRSMDQVLQEAITRFGKQGIKVQYGNRAVNLEVAVARAVRTAINQCNGEIVLQGCREMGVNYVKVSEHLGARVTDTDDYTNHSWWQGKVYSLDWNNPLLGKFEASNDLPNRVEYLAMIKDATERKKAEEYPDFIETCGYGDILGICGVNCRHSFYAWYPGINIDNGPRIDQEENKKRYAQEQKARAMEREIRSLKREIEATKAINTDAGKARLKELKNRLDEKNLAYRDFVEKNKLNAANWRTKITGFSKADAQKANGRATAYSNTIDDNKSVLASISTIADAKRLPDIKEKARVMREAINAKRPVYASDLRGVFGKVKSEDGYYDVCLHGAQHYAEYEHTYKIDAQTLSWIISGRRDYKGDDIRLLSCTTGMKDKNGNCFAQQLANELGVNVKAPVDKLNIGEYDGKLTVGKGKIPFENACDIFVPKGR